MSSRALTSDPLRLARVCVAAGFGIAAGLVGVAGVFNPLDPTRLAVYVVAVYGAIGLLLLLGLWVGVWGLRPRGAAVVAMRLGVRWGAAFGLLWTAEISYNNVLAQPVAIRDPVDDIFWAAVALGMFALAAVAALREGSVWAGLLAGAWSGLVSGLIACLTALLLIVLGMPLLLRDPANLAEWAARGPASGFPTMAAYVAYQTLAGAMLHLVVLGIGMGALLGAVGGTVGRALAAGRRVADVTRASSAE